MSETRSPRSKSRTTVTAHLLMWRGKSERPEVPPRYKQPELPKRIWRTTFVDFTQTSSKGRRIEKECSA